MLRYILALALTLHSFSFFTTTVAQALNETSPLGINLMGVIDYSSELHFINQAKRARPWISQCNGCGWDDGPALDLDEDGWIKSLEAGAYADLILATNPRYEPGEYKVFFKGKGRIEGTLGTTGTVTESGQSITFRPTGNGYMAIRIREVDPTDYIRDIEIIPVEMADYYNEGNIFYPAFKENWAKYRTLRFMDWNRTNNHPNGDWDQRTRPQHYSYGTNKGVPYEVQIRLSNELGAYPWFCIPHLADDYYVRKMAELVRDSLREDLLIYVEHSNEVWNSVFPGQFRHAINRGNELDLRHGGSEFDGLIRYHAQRTAEIMEIWSEVIGRDRLIGVYAVGGPSVYMINKGMEHLESIGKEAMIDVASIAPYVGARASYSTVDEAINALMNSMESLEDATSEAKAAALNHGLRLNAYEGGQHLWNFGQQFSPIGEEAQGDPRMREFVNIYMDTWRANGGDEFMVFGSGGGFWGQIPWGVDPAVAPKYQGHNDFIDANPIWWDEPIVDFEHRLTVNVTGPGTVDISPEKELYDHNETVTLIASPLDNAGFIGWSGNGSGVENTLVVTMNSNKTITATFFDPDAPMVKNGDFSQEDQYWTLYLFGDGDASLSTQQQRADFVITSGGTEEWHVQLYQENITLTESTFYKFSFDAKAQSPRDMVVSLKHNGLPWTPYFVQDVSLTTEMQTYEYVFEMSELTDSASRVEFNLGTSEGNVSIDNVSLTVAENTTGIAPQLSSNSTGIRVNRHGRLLRLNTNGEGSQSVQLYDTKGRVIRSWNIKGAGAHTLSVGTLAGGIYILRVKEENRNFVKRMTF
ncbi:carbohydrate binding domain-containing protein [Chitinispirillales bacterium ANBcel5]|uniref:carbohydrate binding domain-containing protein n=1 Tax=Cellulosispirillum alkaliphilum TaxID=3039283 RepID=UPI002A578B07|nr:carbohydrate binding domain-containing protein [Chitinispirillales bacterium ANBcel5]